MTLEEFKTQVKSILKEHIKDTLYINSLDQNMGKAYEEAQQLKDILGYDTPDPNGYALGIVMMYPELP